MKHILVLVLVLSMGGFGVVDAQTTRHGQTQPQPMGVIVLPHPAVTMQRILDWRKLGLRIPRPVYGGAMMMAMGLSQLVPEFQGLTGLQLIEQFPTIVQKLGFQLNVPTGLSFWQYNQAQIMVFSVQIQEKRLRQWLEPVLESRQGKLRFSPAQGVVRQVSIQSPTGRTSPLGLITGAWFHLLLPQSLNRKYLPRQLTFPILQNIHQAYPHILSSLLRQTITSGLRKSVAQQDADVVTSVNKRWMLQMLLRGTNMTPETARLLPTLRQYLPNVSTVLSLKQGLALRVSLRWANKLPPLFALWKPTDAATHWNEWIPSTIGWFGHMYLHHLAVPGLLVQARKSGLLNQASDAQLMKGWNTAKAEAEKLGIDLVSLLQSWNGEYAAGILWEDKLMQGILAGGSPQKLMLHYTFAALRFRNEAGAKAFLHTVLQVWNKQKTQNRVIPGLSIQSMDPTKDLGGCDFLEIGLPRGLGKVYLVSHKDLVLFAGSLETARRFCMLWQNKHRSLQELKNAGIADATVAQHASLHPELDRGLRSQKGYFVLLPKVFYDLQSAFLSDRHLPQWVPLLQRFQRLSLSSRISAQTYTTSLTIQITPTPQISLQALHQRNTSFMDWRLNRSHVTQFTNTLLMSLGVGVSPSFLSDPMYTGILAAIAIPAFVRYTTRAKISEARLNLPILHRGATAWYESSQLDTKGNPLPRHFPHTGQGWVCTPNKKPCANGHALYSATPSRWQQEPWKSLRFLILRRHYFQYCYQAEGTGTNARFTIRAHADLNCDGTISTYELRGWINKTSGEVETSPVESKTSRK